MHTFNYRDVESGVSVRIHHNGDYSGEAHVEVVRPEGQPDGSVAEVSEGIKIPAQALKQFSFSSACDQIISVIEQLEDEQ